MSQTIPGTFRGVLGMFLGLPVIPTTNQMKTEYDVLDILRRSLPHASRKQLKRIIRFAHGIACSRSDVREFNAGLVLSVIRGSWAAIKMNPDAPVHLLFKPERPVTLRYPILQKPDPLCYLVPNETWAGKGSGGKTNLTEE